jgi:peptide/nickel transport system permease protein
MPREAGTGLERFHRGWYKFSRSKMSIVGLCVVLAIAILAVFAPFVAPYPEHVGAFLDFSAVFRAPSFQHPLGTDEVGRDVLSRIIFGYRFSLILGLTVLSLVVPTGTILGLIAGYYKDSWTDTIIMRTTDTFLSLPPLVLALAIAALLTPNLFNAMVAISLAWWPWYCRMIYSITSSLRNESYILFADVIGAGKIHILFKELLPNCISILLTKMTLDMGFVILIGASLSFVGLGVQPPKPDLGTMLANGTQYLPEKWWVVVFPALAILSAVVGFNLLGDGLRDALGVEEV